MQFRHIQALCKDEPVLLLRFTRLGRPVGGQRLEDAFQLICCEYPTLDGKDRPDLLYRRRHTVCNLYRILPLQLVLLAKISNQFLSFARRNLRELYGVVTRPSLEFPQLVLACSFKNPPRLSRRDWFGLDHFPRQCRINYSTCSGLAITVRVCLPSPTSMT